MIDAEGQAHEFDGWFAAVQRYRALVWEWAALQDDFTETLTGIPFGWVDELYDDGFGYDLSENQPQYLALATNDGMGGDALFRLIRVGDAGKASTTRP